MVSTKRQRDEQQRRDAKLNKQRPAKKARGTKGQGTRQGPNKPEVGHKRRAKQGNQGPRPAKLPALHQDSDSDHDMGVEDEDIEFVNAFGRRLAFLEDLDAAKLKHTEEKAKRTLRAGPTRTLQGAADGVGVNAAKGGQEDALEDVEDTLEYEAAPRSRPKEQEKRAAPLPVKTHDGKVFTPMEGKVPKKVKIQQLQVPVVPGIDIVDPAAEGGEDPFDQKAPTSGKKGKAARKEQRKLRKQAAKDAAAAAAPGDEDSVDRDVEEAPAFRSREERLQAAKLQIAAAAGKLLEDPERHVANLKLLNSLANDADMQLARLSLLSALAVYRDILPGYRIRLPTEKELAVKVSKDVAKLRAYEGAVLAAYQGYLKILLKLAKSSSTSSQRVGLHAMCMLLNQHPHFNYAGDLLQVVVTNMVHREASIAAMCCDAVKELLSGDALGQVSLEAVQLVADLVKRRKCVNCRPAVLHSLLGINIDLLQDPVGATSTSKLSSKQKKQLARKKRKAKQRGDDVDAAFAESNAAPDREERQRLQSLTLEALFEVFFRVLKHATGSQALTAQAAPLQQSVFQRKFPLLRVTLMGLRRYAHLIDVDYFESLVAVLTQLVHAPRMPAAEKLRILLAASHIDRGQGKALTLDNAQLYAGLYSALEELPLSCEDAVEVRGLSDDEEPHDASRVSSPSSGAQQVQVQAGNGVQQEQEQQARGAPLCVEATELLAGALLDQKALDQARLAAFTKALGRGVLGVTGTGLAVGCLVVMQRLLRRHTNLRGLLEDPASGPVGPFGGLSAAVSAPSAEDALESSSAAPLRQAAAPLWELSLACRHYHPHIAAAAAALSRMTEGQTLSQAMFTTYHTPQDAAAAYDTSLGCFRPPPQAPPKAGQHPKRPGKGMMETGTVAAKLSAVGHQSEAWAGPGVEARVYKRAPAAGVVVHLDGTDDGVEQLMKQHFRMLRLFKEHEELRREDRLLLHLLTKSRDH